MRRVLALTFAFAIAATTAVAVAAAPAGACSCAPPTEAEAFERADAVFIGSVEQIYDARTGDPANPEVVVMTVTDVYTGDVTSTQGVVTAADEASCGRDFVIGEAYLVFAADGDDGFYESALCDGTRLLGDRAPDLGISPTLPREGELTVARIQDQLGQPRTSLFPEALIFVGVLGFIVGLAAWFSRKNRPAI